MHCQKATWFLTSISYRITPNVLHAGYLMQTKKYKIKTASSQNEDQSSPDVTDGRESKCCPACRADVYTSRNLIHGPSEEVYNQYARSNSYPTGSDTFKEEFEAAKINLDRLTATIALLEAERTRLKGIVEKYSIILHPMRAIPPGSLQSIFQSCVESLEREEPPKSSLVPSSMPWVLGQVCRYWRNTVLSMPHLWTSIVLDIRAHYYGHNTLSSLIFLLGLQIYRSQGLPLTVTIYCEGLGSNYSGHHPMIVLICARSQQWRNLRIEGHVDMLRTMSSIRGLLSNLESMSINLKETSTYFIQNMELAPALRSLTLHGFTSVKLPWHQIKYFQLRPSHEGSMLVSNNTYMSQVLTTLNQLSGVEVCDLHLDGEIDEHSRGSSLRNNHWHLDFNHLTSLTISARSWRSVPNFIRRITTPKLDCLRITTQFFGWDELLRLISRSSCKLTELSIRAAERGPHNALTYMSNVFSSVQDLTLLELGFCDTFRPGEGEEIISLLSSPMVPRLEKLSIIQFSGSRSPYSDGILLNALEYRWNPPEESGVNRLHTVTLGMKVIDPASRIRLEALRVQGLVVVEKEN
ncbi:hypothetical protein WG66_006742 [Moniliophthora roreri]|nr:hypothetical protein WG66_006742 [Moniliophthora roreri]